MNTLSSPLLSVCGCEVVMDVPLPCPLCHEVFKGSALVT